MNQQIQQNEQKISAETYCCSYFSKLMMEFLNQFAEVFSECSNTTKLHKIYEKYVFKNIAYEKILAESWHTSFLPYYKVLIDNPMGEFQTVLYTMINIYESTTHESKDENERQIYFDKLSNQILRNETKSSDPLIIEFLNQFLFNVPLFIDMLRMVFKWADSSFDEDSRRYTICYFLHMNGFAIMHCIIPNNLIQSVSNEGQDIIDHFKKNSSTDENNSQMPNIDTSSLFNNPFEFLKENNDSIGMIRNACSSLPKQSILGLMRNSRLIGIALANLNGAGLENGSMLESFLEKSKSSIESQPIRNMLTMFIPFVRNFQPETFDLFADFAESDSFETTMNTFFSGNFELENIFNSDAFTNILPLLQGFFQNCNQGGDVDINNSQQMELMQSQLLEQMNSNPTIQNFLQNNAMAKSLFDLQPTLD